MNEVWELTCVIAIGQFRNEFVGIGSLCSTVHVFIRHVLTSIFDVLFDRTGKQHWLLTHHADLR